MLLWNVRGATARCSIASTYEQLLQDYGTDYAPVPGPDHPTHDAMLAELRRMFDAHRQHGRVELLHDTEFYFGPLRASLDAV